jgi:RNA polymerase sigma-70 factor (ECF subfamily)
MAEDEQGASFSSTAGIEHIDGLFGYALVLTRNRASAEDLVQETYVRALKAGDRLHENSNVKAWLFTILRNIWLNELRKRRSSPVFLTIDDKEIPAESLAGSEPGAHEVLESNENVQSVQAAIRSLPLSFREVILMREFENLSYQEMANVLGCPTGTVMSRLGRARAKLRELLADTLMATQY